MSDAPPLSPDFFERLCNSTSFAMIAANQDLRIGFWNHMAVRLFGSRPENMLGQPLPSVFPESVRAQATAMLEAAVRDGTAQDLEFDFHEPNGHEILLTAVISPIHGHDGARLGVSVCLRDITKRRDLTRQLSQDRRLTSLGKMAGGVAHHFNSILAGALTRLETILKDARLAPRFHRDVTQVYGALDRAVRVSRQLMLYADGDPDPGKPRPLAEILRECVAGMQGNLEARSVRLTVDIADDGGATAPDQCVCDILNSLVQNSVDVLTNGGDIHISLSVDAPWAVLVLTDSGTGISADKLPHMFEPFYTTKGGFGGSASQWLGLSLSVVQKFVHDMGGRIDVSSPPGQGARFEIRLPLPAQA